MVTGVLLQNSPVRAGIFIFTSHRTDGAFVQLLWRFNEHLNDVIRAGQKLSSLFFSPPLKASFPFSVYLSHCDCFYFIKVYQRSCVLFSKCGSPSIFSKSSSVSDSEPAAVPSASCNWEMPRWVSVGTRSVSYLQILPRQIVFAKLRFQGFHHIGKIHLPDHLGRVRIVVLWLIKGCYAHMSLWLVDY